jgi:hypothetical protein
VATIQGALRDLLAADAAVTALLGSGADCRIYPLDAPHEHTRPYALYRREGETRAQALAGLTNLRECLMVYDCFGAESAGYASADAVAQAIKDELLSLGRVSLAAGAIRLEGVVEEGADDDVNVPEAQEELGVMRTTVAFRVFWNQG